MHTQYTLLKQLHLQTCERAYGQVHTETDSRCLERQFSPHDHRFHRVCYLSLKLEFCLTKKLTNTSEMTEVLVKHFVNRCLLHNSRLRYNIVLHEEQSGVEFKKTCKTFSKPLRFTGTFECILIKYQLLKEFAWLTAAPRCEAL